MVIYMTGIMRTRSMKSPLSIFDHTKTFLSLLLFRVLCALVNSFVPETFTTEVLLNDRLAIHLFLICSFMSVTHGSYSQLSTSLVC